MGVERVDGRPETVSEVFAAFVEASSWSDIGPRLRHEAKRSLLNFFGCALGAANSDPIAIAVSVMRRLAERRRSRRPDTARRSRSQRDSLRRPRKRRASFERRRNRGESARARQTSRAARCYRDNRRSVAPRFAPSVNGLMGFASALA